MTEKGSGGGEYNKGFVYFMCAIAATAGLLFGFDTGVISGALLFIRQEFALSPGYQEWVVSAVLIGAVIGAGSSGKLSDIFGRRNIIFVTAILFALGSIFLAVAPAAIFLVIGRVFLGLAIGVASFAAPLYISEVSPPQVRGMLVSLNQLMITIGIVVSYMVNLGFESWDSGWRYMLGFGAVPAIILGIGILMLPKTPRWLMSKGREEEAKEALKRAMPEDKAEEELKDIRISLEKEKGQQGSFGELFAPHLRIPLMIGILLAFFQQATGINTIIYYAPTIFKMAGFASAKAAIGATVGVGIVNVLMTVVAVQLLDKMGRRPLLLIGMIGMVLSLGILGAGFMISPPAYEITDEVISTLHTDQAAAKIDISTEKIDKLASLKGTEFSAKEIKEKLEGSGYTEGEVGIIQDYGIAPASGILKWMSLGSIFFYIACFAISLGPIFWLIIAEIYPLKIRGLAMSIATLSNWLFNWLVAFTFLTLVTNVGQSYTFWLYGGVAIIGIIFSFFYCPETKGKTLEEIEEHWLAGKAPRAL